MKLEIENKIFILESIINNRKNEFTECVFSEINDRNTKLTVNAHVGLITNQISTLERKSQKIEKELERYRKKEEQTKHYVEYFSSIAAKGDIELLKKAAIALVSEKVYENHVLRKERPTFWGVGDSVSYKGKEYKILGFAESKDDRGRSLIEIDWVDYLAVSSEDVELISKG